MKIICATSRVIFRPLPFCKLPHFLRLLPPPLCTSVKHFLTRHSVIERRSERSVLIIPRMRAAIVQSKSFAYYVGPSDWNCLPQSLHLELLSLSPIQPQR